MAIDFGERPTMTIPVPAVAPLGIPVDTRAMIQEVWDAIIVPRQNAGFTQSVEERTLMGILRAVYEGMEN